MRQSLFDISDDPQYQPPGSWDQNSRYAPTPGSFGRTPSPSLSTFSSRFPERSSTPQQSEPARLGFLPLADWEEGRTYNEQSPTYLQYLIEWRVALNNRVVAKDTEQDLVLAPSSYWEQVLRGKLDDVLGRKVSRSRRVRSDDTSIIVSVNDRSQRDLTKLFKKTDVDWKAVEKQLLMWGSLYRVGKKLRLSISFNYIEDSNPGTSKSADKRGPSSVTRRMLAEQDSQIDAERVSGHPSVWRDVYRVMRCPGPPCHLGPYCWQDPQGRKHYRLRTSHLTSLVKYVEQGGILETHDDVPGMVRDQLYAEEQQRFDRQRKSTKDSAVGSTCPPININVLPTSSSQPSVMTTSASTPNTLAHSNPRPFDYLTIRGLRDVAVKKYSEWQELNVGDEALKADFRKARDVALANGLDLEQILNDQDPEFFTNSGVKVGIARRFVSDINEWVHHYEDDMES